MINANRPVADNINADGSGVAAAGLRLMLSTAKSCAVDEITTLLKAFPEKVI